MPDLSPATRKDLEVRRTALAMELGAIDLILGRPSGNGASPKRRARVKTTAEGGVGFRGAIREVLNENCQGLRPSEVTPKLEAKLEARGTPYTGNTRLKMRVSNELHRMSVIGQVHRTGTGRYKPVKDDRR